MTNLQLSDEGTNLAKWTATYTPTANINNVEDSISFTVVNSNNSSGVSNEATLAISISPVNDAPVVAPIYPDISNNYLVVNEDSCMSIPFTAIDFDGDHLDLSVSSTNSNVNVSLGTGNFSVSYTHLTLPTIYSV